MGCIRRQAADFYSESVHGPAREPHAAHSGSAYRRNDRPRAMNRATSVASDPERNPPLRFRATYYKHRAQEWWELANSTSLDAPIRLRILRIAQTYTRLAEQVGSWERDRRPAKPT